MSMFIGESLAGDGNEVAHIDLLIGTKDGPVGIAFANALSRQSEGHSNLLAVLTPNLAVKPATVMITIGLLYIVTNNIRCFITYCHSTTVAILTGNITIICGSIYSWP